MQTWILVIIVALLLLGCEDRREKDAETLYQAAMQYSEEGEYDKAIELLRRMTIDYTETEASSKAERDIDSIMTLQQMLVDNQRSRISQKFKKIAVALEQYQLRYLSYPLTVQDLEKLPPSLVPEFLDEWDHPILYKPYVNPDGDPTRPDNYALASFGKDGLPGGKGLNQDRFFQNEKEVVQLQLP